MSMKIVAVCCALVRVHDAGTPDDALPDRCCCSEEEPAMKFVCLEGDKVYSPASTELANFVAADFAPSIEKLAFAGPGQWPPEKLSVSVTTKTADQCKNGTPQPTNTPDEHTTEDAYRVQYSVTPVPYTLPADFAELPSFKSYAYNAPGDLNVVVEGDGSADQVPDEDRRFIEIDGIVYERASEDETGQWPDANTQLCTKHELSARIEMISGGLGAAAPRCADTKECTGMAITDVCSWDSAAATKGVLYKRKGRKGACIPEAGQEVRTEKKMPFTDYVLMKKKGSCPAGADGVQMYHSRSRTVMRGGLRFCDCTAAAGARLEQSLPCL